MAAVAAAGRRPRSCALSRVRRSPNLDEKVSISVVARHNGVAPNLLTHWRCLMLKGGAVAVTIADEVTSNRAVRQLEERIRELERQLGRKTLEVEILKEALDKARPKKPT